MIDSQNRLLGGWCLSFADERIGVFIWGWGASF
jgi:hypothetical protein